MATRTDIYGVGLDYPFRWDETVGGAALAEGPRSVVASLIRLFDVAPGESFTNPEYGCALRLLVFENDDEVFRALAVNAVREAVSRWEPRVDDILEIQLERDDNTAPHLIFLRVFFSLIDDQQTYNFVYPFTAPE